MISTTSTAATSGFSLIDLMITIVIASVLAAIAIPGYRDHTQRSAVAEVTSQLMIVKLKLEQFYQDNRHFGAETNGNNCGITLPTQRNFTYTCTTQNLGQSYLITASGIQGQGMQEFEYTLDGSGMQRTTRIPRQWGTPPLNCWILKRNMAC